MGALPNFTGCFVCGEATPGGLKVTFHEGDGSVRARFRLDESQSGYPGIAHGGVISAILDEIMGWAPTFAKKRMCVAAEITVRFITPLPVGVEVEARSRFKEDRKRVWEAEGEVVGTDGTVYARGTGKYMPIAIEKTLDIDKGFAYKPNQNRILWGEATQDK